MPTPIHCNNNNNTIGVINSTINCQQAWAINMRYSWLSRSPTNNQGVLPLGVENLGNYQLKINNDTHHTHVLPCYPHSQDSPTWFP